MDGAEPDVEVMRGGLASAASFMTGPWGIAMTAGRSGSVLGQARNADAKQHVEDLTTTAIEADSGALGKNTRETFVANALEQEGRVSRSGPLHRTVAKERR
jgi:hypothetical protein